MSYTEYHADLKGHVRERDDALLELEAAGDDEKAADAAIEKIKAYSTLIARRKTAIAALPSLEPCLPCGMLYVGRWTYIFDPDNGNKWVDTDTICSASSNLHRNLAQRSQFAQGAGVKSTSGKRTGHAVGAIELIVEGKFCSISEDVQNNITYIAVFDHQSREMKIIAQHPRTDIDSMAAAAIGSTIYISCKYHNGKEENYVGDDVIRTLDVSRDPPIWGEIPVPAPIDAMFRSGDCIVTAGYAPGALGVICAGVWTPLPDPFPGRKIIHIEWFDHLPGP